MMGSGSITNFWNGSNEIYFIKSIAYLDPDINMNVFRILSDYSNKERPAT